MLTPIQIEKLRTLTVSQKFGKLLEDAITIWSTQADVLFDDFGLIFNDETDTYNVHKNKKCCLIGASLIGKRTTDFEDIEYSVDRVFKIPYREVRKIWEGFDYRGVIVKSEFSEQSESFMFGYSVRQILLENSEENSENKT